MPCHFVRRGRERKGFTLVELLVVIGIIAVLISLLLPALNKVRSQSMTVACGSNLRQLGLSFQMYCQDNRGKLPNLWTDYSSLGWFQTVSPYLGFRSKDPSKYRIGYVGPDAQYDHILACPARETSEKYDQTYGVNYTAIFSYWVDASKNPPGGALGDPAYYGSAKLAKVPARIFIAADARSLYGSGRTEILNSSPMTGNWGQLNYDYDKDGILDSIVTELFAVGPYNGVYPIHGGKGRVRGMGTHANFLFADGSVRLLPITSWARNEDGMWGKMTPPDAYR